MPSARPDVAIVGAGLMGRWHAATSRRLGGHIVGVVDVDEARGRGLARGNELYFHDLESLLASATPQIAHVCSPVGTHPDFVKRLLSAGIHVICEKPLAGDLQSVQELLACGQAAGRSIAPVHQFAFQNGVDQVVASLPRLGKLRRISFEIASAGAEGGTMETRDAVLLDILPHPLSVLKRLLPSVPLAEAAWQVQHPSPGELLAQTTLSGIAIAISLSLSIRPTAAGALLAGTGGSVRLDFFHGYAVERSGQVSRSRKMLAPFTSAVADYTSAAANLMARTLRWEPAYPGLRNLVAAFYANPAAAGATPQVAATLDIYAACAALAARL